MWKFLDQAAGGGCPSIKTLPGTDNGVSIAGPEHHWSWAQLALAEGFRCLRGDGAFFWGLK